MLPSIPVNTFSSSFATKKRKGDCRYTHTHITLLVLCGYETGPLTPTEGKREGVPELSAENDRVAQTNLVVYS
jgi:hypothetical protein